MRREGGFMEIDGYNEILHMFNIAKKLYDMGKYDLVTSCFSDKPDYDDYYHGMYSLIEGFFEYSTGSYNEYRCLELNVLSCAEIVDFYVLAGEYGKLNNIPDNANPYIQAAREKVSKSLNISHCLDWMIMEHTEPKRPFHSRIGIFISHDCGCADIGVIAYRLIGLYEWYQQQCVELKAKLAALKSPVPPFIIESPKFTERQAIAA